MNNKGENLVFEIICKFPVRQPATNCDAALTCQTRRVAENYVDKIRATEYCLPTTGRCCGRKPILKRLPTTQNAVSLAIREPANERRRTVFESFCAPPRLPASPGGHHNEDADLGPARVFVGSNACTGGSSPNGIGASRVHLCKSVSNPSRELGGILGGQREVCHSGSGKVSKRRHNP